MKIRINTNALCNVCYWQFADHYFVINNVCYIRITYNQNPEITTIIQQFLLKISLEASVRWSFVKKGVFCKTPVSETFFNIVAGLQSLFFSDLFWWMVFQFDNEDHILKKPFPFFFLIPYLHIYYKHYRKNKLSLKNLPNSTAEVIQLQWETKTKIREW